MSFKTINFNSTGAMDRFLNGALQGGVSVSKAAAASGGKLRGLNGLTLNINATLVTFVDAADAGIPLTGAGSIKSVIEAAVSGSLVSWEDGKLTLAHASGITLLSSGTANKYFGFPTGGASLVGTVHNPPGGAAPRVLFIGASPTGEGYSVTLELS